MHDGPEKPAMADFTKTLTVVLLAQYAAVTGWLALLPLLDADSRPALAAWVIGLVLPGLLLASLGTNLASMCIAWRFRKDGDIAPFARTSLMSTAAQTALLVASVTVGTHRFAVAACVLTAAMIAAILRWWPGRMLRPPPPG